MISLESFTTALVRASDYHRLDNAHHERTSRLAVEIGLRLEMDQERLRRLDCSASLHDLGRVGVDHDILKHPGKLTAGEWGSIRTHPRIGYDILHGILDEEICLGILHHHENWDGTGYPDGLSGEAIPLFSRIIALADRWDALRNKRPYREALNFENALHFINMDFRYFDPQLYVLFMDIVRESLRNG